MPTFGWIQWASHPIVKSVLKVPNGFLPFCVKQSVAPCGIQQLIIGSSICKVATANIAANGVSVFVERNRLATLRCSCQFLTQVLKYLQCVWVILLLPRLNSRFIL